MIGLLGKGKGEKEEGGLLESMEPEALTDEKVNKQNKAKAVMMAKYGPSDDKMRSCESCEYFDMDYANLGKDEGLCELFEFKCSKDGLCAAYDFNKEDLKEEYEEE